MRTTDYRNNASNAVGAANCLKQTSLLLLVILISRFVGFLIPSGYHFASLHWIMPDLSANLSIYIIIKGLISIQLSLFNCPWWRRCTIFVIYCMHLQPLLMFYFNMLFDEEIKCSFLSVPFGAVLKMVRESSFNCSFFIRRNHNSWPLNKRWNYFYVTLLYRYVYYDFFIGALKILENFIFFVFDMSTIKLDLITRTALQNNYNSNCLYECCVIKSQLQFLEE